jgi:hypothetical protein
VWHCSLRAAPEDRTLTDAEWNEVAVTVLDSTGLAKAGDDGGCRWVAVRHADDHVHLIVTLARQDGRKASTSNDFYKVAGAAHEIETRFGLRVTAASDRTAGPQPTRAENEKAARTGMREPARVVLRREVRTAAAGARTADEFFERLKTAGVMVKTRMSERNPDQITGFAVGLPELTTGAGGVVWFGGSKLGADLSWSKLAHRWNTPSVGNSERAATWEHAATIALDAVGDIGRSPDGAGDVAHATGDLLAALARAVDGPAGRGALTDVAGRYQRAALEPWARTQDRTMSGDRLRFAALAITALGRPKRGGSEITQVVLAVLVLVDAIATLRAAQGRRAQAEAAFTAARQLRAIAGQRDTVTTGGGVVPSVAVRRTGSGPEPPETDPITKRKRR